MSLNHAIGFFPWGVRLKFGIHFSHHIFISLSLYIRLTKASMREVCSDLKKGLAGNVMWNTYFRRECSMQSYV